MAFPPSLRSWLSLLLAAGCSDYAGATTLHRTATALRDGQLAGLEEVKQRMRYWSDTKPEIPQQSSGSYLIFEPDIGGLNNIRIGWEAAGFAAASSGRTLVLPPGKPWYLLDQDDMSSTVEDFVNLAQLKNGLPTLTFEEFEEKEQAELQKRGIVRPTQDGGSSPAEAYKAWMDSAQKGFDKIEGNVCSLSNYQKAEQKFLFVPSDTSHRIFGCGVWNEMGQPRFLASEGGRAPIPAWGYKLLKDDFVWNDRFYELAAPVVEHLGMFQYFAMHARFGDFQYEESRQPFGKVADALVRVEGVADGTDAPQDVKSVALLQMSSSLQSTALRARRRGKALLGRLDGLIPENAMVYISTDEKKPELLEAFTSRGIKAVRFQDLLEQGEDGPLASLLQAANGDKRLVTKWSGPIEQLICAYSRVFVGTAKSTFSGYIARMRTYNGAPQWRKPLFHTVQLEPEDERALHDELAAWDAAGGAATFDPDAIDGVFPPDQKHAQLSAVSTASTLASVAAAADVGNAPSLATSGAAEVDSDAVEKMRKMLEASG
eukprot:TRINITY_DN5056_c0_g1_i1.p1 TRINITY_DN5056_c0_g1~~TRINITY_DN5056_c0_g1_i1.p1  ORF type:complete len:544 (-),score=180.74 TRINITY_DN5056_c0_g1_i1:56-1687(-)